MHQHSKTNWAKVDSLKDSDIDYSDVPELSDDFFKNAKLKMPPHKSPVTLRLDDDILDWFRKEGRGYQTRINQLLRKYMETHSKESHT